MEAITEEEPNELENSMDSLGSAVTEEASSENEPEERNVVDAAAQSHDPVFLESGAEVLDSMGGYSDDFEGSELSSCHDRANDCSDSGAILNVPQQEIERNSSGSAEGCFSATGTQPRTPLKPEAGDVFRDELRQLQLQAENEGSQYFAQYDNLVDNRLAEVIGEETGEDPFNLLLTWPALTEDGIIAPEVAALRIQASFGHASNPLRKVVRGRQGRLDARRHQHAYLTLQSHFRGYQQELGKRRLQKQHQEAAVQIQAVVRGGKSRVLVKKFRSENAVCICGRMPFGEMIACIDCYDFFHFEKAKPALPEEEMERNPALSKSGTSVSFLPSLVEPNNESTTEYQEAMEATSEREAEPLSLPPIHSERVMSGREQAAPASMEPTDKTTQKKPKVQKGIQKTKEVAQAFAGVETEGAATFDDFVRREGSVAGSDKSTKVKRKRNGKADKLSSPKEFGAARSQKV
eukprot:gene6767-8091_t